MAITIGLGGQKAHEGDQGLLAAAKASLFTTGIGGTLVLLGFCGTIWAALQLDKEAAAVATAFGTFASALGALLLSYALTREQTKAEARAAIDTQLDNLGRQISTVSAQLQHTLVKLRDESIDEETVVELIQTHTVSLGAIIIDISKITGHRPDFDEFASNLDDIRHLVQQIQAGDSAGQDPTETANEARATEEILRKLEELEGKVKAANPTARIQGRRAEQVKCPYCEGSNGVALGLNVGDSAHSNCGTCNEVFHSHRGPAESIFTRKSGKGATSTSAAATK